MTTLGARIRMLRQHSGHSQRSLAEGLVTKSMISQIESDKVRPSQDLLAAVAERLGVSVDELMHVQASDQERLARYKQGQAFLALAHYREALPLLQESLEHPHPSWPLLELLLQTSECLGRMGRLSEARVLLGRALRLAVQEERAEAVVSCHYWLGKLAEAEGQLHVARNEWTLAYREWKEHPKEVGWELTGEVCLHFAHAMREYGQGEEAIRGYQEAGKIWRGSSTHTRRQAEVQGGLARAWELVGDGEAALKHYGKAHKLFMKARDARAGLEIRLARALLRGRLGTCETAWEEALEELEVCGEEAEALEQERLVAQAWEAQAELLLERGEVMRAVDKLQAAVDRLPPKERRTELWLKLANVLVDAGELTRALQAALQAQQTSQPTEEREAAQILARICKRQGDYEQANHWVARSHELMRQSLVAKGLRL